MGDTRAPLEIENLESEGGWYTVEGEWNYGPGTYHPLVEIRFNSSGQSHLVSTLSLEATIGEIAFLSMPTTLFASSAWYGTIAKFSLTGLSLDNLEAEIRWSDGQSSTGKLMPIAGGVEVISAREFSGVAQMMSAEIRIRSLGSLSIPFESPEDNPSDQFTEQSTFQRNTAPSGSSNTTQNFYANPGSGSSYLPLVDVSKPGCPNEFKIYLDDENYEIDATDDTRDDARVKQKLGGKFGRRVLVNDGDENDNRLVDSDENISGVSTLVGHIVPLVLSFTNPPQPPSTTPPDVEIALSGWNTSVVRLWRFIGGIFSAIDPEPIPRVISKYH